LQAAEIGAFNIIEWQPITLPLKSHRHHDIFTLIVARLPQQTT
jgi:hypothetical protein